MPCGGPTSLAVPRPGAAWPREQPLDGHRHRSPRLLAVVPSTGTSVGSEKKRKGKKTHTHTHKTVTSIHSQASRFLPFFFLVKPLFHPSWHITYRLRKSQSHTAVRPEIPHLGLQMRQELGLTSVAAGDARPGHLLCRQHLVSSCVSISKYLDNVRSVQLIF